MMIIFIYYVIRLEIYIVSFAQVKQVFQLGHFA